MGGHQSCYCRTASHTYIHTTMADAASSMTPEESYELITRGLQEVLGKDNIMQMLKDGKTPSLYWGTAPTGRRESSPSCCKGFPNFWAARASQRTASLTAG